MGTKLERFVLGATAVGIFIFWAIFMATLKMQPSTTFAVHEPCWLKWELSFPIADIIFGIMALVALILHLRNRPSAFMVQAFVAGGLIFLAVMGITFFIQNQLYIGKDGVIEAGIHAYLLIAGIFLAWGSFSKTKVEVRK